MESRYHHARFSLPWRSPLSGLLVALIVGMSAPMVPDASGSWPAVAPSGTRRAPRGQVPTPPRPTRMPEAGCLRRLPPVSKVPERREKGASVAPVTFIPDMRGTAKRQPIDLVSAIGRPNEFGFVQGESDDTFDEWGGGEVRPDDRPKEPGASQGAWPLPSGMPEEHLPPMLGTGDTTESSPVVSPFEFNARREELFAPEPIEFIPTPTPIETNAGRETAETIPAPTPIRSIPHPGSLEPVPALEVLEPIPMDTGSVVYEDSSTQQLMPFFRPSSLFRSMVSTFQTHRGSCDRGVGYERVAMAPFIVDIARPMNHFAARIDAAYGWGLPDRAELLLARPSFPGLDGLGPPLIEPSVDFQDLSYVAEIGGPAFSVRTVIPLRVLDPVVNANTAGLGDIQTRTKLRLLNGESWMITQVNNVYMNSGNSKKGLGTGHMSLEMGMLAGYQWSDETYLHGELKFLVPMGGHQLHQGNMLRWGMAASHLWYDSDAFALIPTVETVFYSILDGQATSSSGGLLHVDGETITTMHCGLRVVLDNGSDFGLTEWGVSAGFSLGDAGWYDSLLAVELRTMF